MYTSHLAKQLAIKIHTRQKRKTHSSHTGMYSSHTAKEKFTRTQREAHSL